MSAFDEAWSLLKALPEDTLTRVPRHTTLGRYRRERPYDSPEMAGEHEFGMTMHPAIAGLLRRIDEGYNPLGDKSPESHRRFGQDKFPVKPTTMEDDTPRPKDLGEPGTRTSTTYPVLISQNQSEAVDRANRDRGMMRGIEGFLARGPNFAPTDSEGNVIDRMPKWKDTRYDDYDVATRGTETEGLSPYYNIGMVDFDPDTAVYHGSRNPAHVDVPLKRLQNLERLTGKPLSKRPYPELDSVEPWDKTINYLNSVVGLEPIELPPSARLPLTEPGVPYTAVMDSM